MLYDNSFLEGWSLRGVQGRVNYSCWKLGELSCPPQKDTNEVVASPQPRNG